MTTVAVDLEDLKTIVYATSVIKAIEGALASYKRDPFVQPHLNYAAAHDRLASAMRNAERAALDTVVSFDEPLNDEETRALRRVDKAKGGVLTVSINEKAAPDQVMSVYDRLAAKGCVAMGQYVQGIQWAGQPAPALTGDPKGFAAALTPRGRNKLVDADTKK